LLAFNADERSERYNMADTLKAQHTHKLALGNVLYSDMGRPLLSIMGDSFGWHDTICGTTNAAMIEATYGLNDFQLARNGYYRNGRDGFLMELGRWGLGRRDLVPNANFFSTVTVDDEGNIALSEASYQPGAWVELRAELNVLVILSTAPHPLREGPAYPEGEIEAGVFWAGEVPATDLCRTACGENQRGFENAEAWFALPDGGPKA
jgi:urea carboxylase-associated protein 2